MEPPPTHEWPHPDPAVELKITLNPAHVMIQQVFGRDSFGAACSTPDFVAGDTDVARHTYQLIVQHFGEATARQVRQRAAELL